MAERGEDELLHSGLSHASWNEEEWEWQVKRFDIFLGKLNPTLASRTRVPVWLARQV